MCNEELHNLYSSPNINGVIKSWRMRWAGHVAPWQRGGNGQNILVGKSKRKETIWET
jgi:hypothetical protein